jgi:hypothetical protein
MLYRDTIGILCGQNAEFLNVTHGGKHSNYWILSGYNIPTYNWNLQQELCPIKFSLASSFLTQKMAITCLRKEIQLMNIKFLPAV